MKKILNQPANLMAMGIGLIKRRITKTLRQIKKIKCWRIKIKINQFYKRTWKNQNQPVLTFKTCDFDHDVMTKLIEDKQNNKKKSW